ncbi:uncharacterized protein LOC129173573 isoform X2 [Dunckerocampus dactyliophorus]|uniref:uncharacterized protein LOC129173573 isoform X2 n=1 Tax=Dunckerocampus dactyliophorus TaxID=161453 RepID=UPI002406EB35|nr:uncharacterized protein LOC129173573 isoform X2 [Dunckerocampus dactyliophorus]
MTKWTYHMTAPPFEDFDEWHQRDVKSSFYVFSFEAQTSAEMLQLNCLLPSSSATRDSASRLLPLLLLVELLLPSWCRPAHNIALCDVLRSAVPRVDQLLGSSGHLHDLSIDVLLAALLEDTLEGLPVIHSTAAHLHALKVNESLSQLYVHMLAFRVHVDWLKAVKENFSLPAEAAESASGHLLQLSNLIRVSLHQVNEPIPPPPRPSSLPVVSTTFDALRYSVEMSQRLKVFCSWTKRVIHHVQRASRCPRR